MGKGFLTYTESQGQKRHDLQTSVDLMFHDGRLQKVTLREPPIVLGSMM